VNWEDAISPELSPAAAAIAAKLPGNCAPCSAADSPDADTISCPDPRMFVGIWLKMVCILLSELLDRMVVGEGLKDGELAVVKIGVAAEMTDAVFVPMRERGGG